MKKITFNALINHKAHNYKPIQIEVAVHLFEVLIESKYIYRGQVRLCDTPFQEKQNDEKGNSRKVWIFPVKVIEPQNVDKLDFDNYLTTQKNRARVLSDNDLERVAVANSRSKCSHRKIECRTNMKY